MSVLLLFVEVQEQDLVAHVAAAGTEMPDECEVVAVGVGRKPFFGLAHSD